MGICGEGRGQFDLWIQEGLIEKATCEQREGARHTSGEGLGEGESTARLRGARAWCV